MGLGIDEIGRLGARYQKQIAEQLAGKAANPKYRNQHAKRSSSTGTQIKFDSKKEAARYDALMELLRAGLIAELKLQPEFTLQEAFVMPNGEKVQAIRYRADFSYRTPAGAYIVEDVKGVRTDVYKLKRKMVLEKYGIEIVEV